MSLTTAQWKEMWKDAKRIETLTLTSELSQLKKQQILAYVEAMKNLIQSVVGPME